jgi:hypothetical protein
MKKKTSYFTLPVVSLIATMILPVSGAQEQDSTRSPSEQQAIAILKNMGQYLAQAERFSVTIRDGYDAVQQSGQKVEFGELRKVTVSRPDRLRIEVERSDGEKGLVIFNGKDLAVYNENKNVYAAVSREGTLDLRCAFYVYCARWCGSNSIFGRTWRCGCHSDARERS